MSATVLSNQPASDASNTGAHNAPALPPQSPEALASDSTIPSREAILAFVSKSASSGLSVGKREIVRAFGLKGPAKLALKQRLRALFAEGALKKQFSKIHPISMLPPVALVDIVRRTSDGELVAVPVEWDEARQGKPPFIFIDAPRRAQTLAAAPAIGQRALVRLTLQRAEEVLSYSGRIIKLIAKEHHERLGIIRKTKDGRFLLTPIDKKSEPLVLPRDGAAPEDDGLLVRVDVPRARSYGQMPGSMKIRERLGAITDETCLAMIALASHDIPHVFPRRVLAEAEALAPLPLQNAKREDWCHVPFITIDPQDARDHDDAVYACPDPDPANGGGFIVTVAIADVAAYVRSGSALDHEALLRGNSVYFPGCVVPMLPERLSNDFCSLRPNEPRAALAVRLILDREGHKKRHSFHRILMRSRAKLSYEEAQALADGRGESHHHALRETIIAPLFAAYRAAHGARQTRAPLALDVPERKIALDAKGKIARIYVPERLEAHRLIEEFMILANVAAAETLEARQTPLIYRVHDAPTLEKLRDLSEFLKSFGISLARADHPPPARFNAILTKVKDSAHALLVHEVVLRAQAQAEYSAQNYGHYGLHLRRYAHFTSPIRRYADLIVHRALIRALGLGDDGLANDDIPRLGEISASISVTERRAMRAERETTERLIASHLCEQVGAHFAGRISGVTGAGLFIRLNETGAEGFIPASVLSSQHNGDYLSHHARTHALTGERSRAHYQLGDPVEVRLLEALPFAGALRFELIDHPCFADCAGAPSAPRPYATRARALQHQAAREHKAPRARKRRGRG